MKKKSFKKWILDKHHIWILILVFAVSPLHLLLIPKTNPTPHYKHFEELQDIQNGVYELQFMQLFYC